MPSFYPRQRALPLTPPESMYNYGTGQGCYSGNNRKSVYDYGTYNNNYYAPQVPSMMGYQAPTMPSNAGPPGLSHQASSFGPIAAPILPPINDRVDAAHQSQMARDVRVKEDKPVGGVSAVLDYEMDQMTDYVSEMAQTIVMPGTTVSPAFRKFVSGLLSSTRLPSSTILLGLTYLARRIAGMNAIKPFKATDGQVWRMLTVALLLGSKFLDDNTFQNRSWSEVSGIPVSELNVMEHEWLEAISWNLHINLETSEDFKAWLVSWPEWREKRIERNASMERLALSTVDTNIQRPRAQRKSSFSPTATSYTGYRQSTLPERQPSHYVPSRYDHAQWVQPSSELSPPSAPDSGPTTPEYLSLPGAGLPPVNALGDWYVYHSYYSRRSRPSSTQMPYVQTQVPSYGPYHGYASQNIWNGHGAGCGCGYCGRPNDAYMMAPGFGQQTVVG